VIEKQYTTKRAVTVISLKEVLDRLLILKDDDWRLKLMKYWGSCIGPLHSYVCLESIVHDTLVVGVYDVHWMHELYMLSPTIVREVNKMLGATYINRLKLKLVQRRSSAPLKRLIAPVVPRIIQRELTPDEQRALEHVKDKELQKALHAFLIKSQGESI
jgi:hypothetical protein